MLHCFAVNGTFIFWGVERDHSYLDGEARELVLEKSPKNVYHSVYV